MYKDKYRRIFMKYENKGLLMDWQNNIDKVAELTKHSPVRTAKKSRLSDLLSGW